MRNVLFLVLLALAGAGVTRGQGSVMSATSTKIIELERESRIQAYERKDLKALSAVLDEGYVSVNAEGRLQTKADVMLFVHVADSIHSTLQLVEVRVHDNTAVATGLHQMKADVRGKPMLLRVRFVDTWLLKDGQWVVIASLSIPTQ